MNDILDRNIKALKENHPEIKINESIVSNLKEKEFVEELVSYNGFNLRSRVDQTKAIDVWCEQFEELSHNNVVLVFGTGTLDYFVEFKKRYSTLSLIIYEPCEDIFYNILTCKDYTKLLKEDNIIFCMGDESYGKFMGIIYKSIGYESISKPYYTCIPNYHKIFEEEYDKYEETIVNSLKSGVISRNTMMVFEEERLDNYLDNLSKVADETSLVELKEAFDKVDTDKYPAILLSAGPSLDKNIKQLSDLKGRAFVLAVDAAVNTATRNNIRPDMIISIDPAMYEDSLRDQVGRELPLVIHMYGSRPIRDINKGRKFYTTDVDRYLKETLKVCNKEVTALNTGGSVANTAFSVLKELGFETIILMGQDLGFPGNKFHAKDAFEGEEDIDESEGGFFYVESIDGGQVLTTTNMEQYKKWFEDTIRLNPDINVVDATEGGALIKGSEILTIKEAKEKYCQDERIDFEAIINSSEYMLNDDEKKTIKGIINKTFDDIDYNIEYFEKAKRDYYKLRDLNEKRKYNSKEFKRIIDKIGERNKYIDENKDFHIYKKCCTQKYFECIDALKNVYEDKYKDIKNLVEQSIIMLDEYIKAAKRLKEKWDMINNRE